MNIKRISFGDVKINDLVHSIENYRDLDGSWDRVVGIISEPGRIVTLVLSDGYHLIGPEHHLVSVLSTG